MTNNSTDFYQCFKFLPKLIIKITLLIAPTWEKQQTLLHLPSYMLSLEYHYYIVTDRSKTECFVYVEGISLKMGP